MLAATGGENRRRGGAAVRPGVRGDIVEEARGAPVPFPRLEALDDDGRRRERRRLTAVFFVGAGSDNTQRKEARRSTEEKGRKKKSGGGKEEGWVRVWRERAERG